MKTASTARQARTITPKNAAKLQIFKIAIPVAGALLFGAFYHFYTPPQMQALRPDAAGFSVDLPCSTHRIVSTLDGPWGVQSQTDYLCAADGVHYVVGYTDLPHEVVAPFVKAQDTQQLLAQWAAQQVARTGGTLRSGYSHPTYGDYTIDVTAERGWLSTLQSWLPRWGRASAQPPQHTHVMTIKLQLQGERLYMMHVLQPQPPSYNQELYAHRALRSFRVPKNEPK